MVFYNPFTTRISGISNEPIPAIVYPSLGAEKVFSLKERGCLERYLQQALVINKQNVPSDTEYMISVLWEDNNSKMADVRLSRQVQSYGFGPLNFIALFRNLEPYTPDPTKPEGHTCGNEDAIIGREEEHRVRAGEDNLQEFLFGRRPALPKRLRVGKSFYLVR